MDNLVLASSRDAAAALETTRQLLAEYSAKTAAQSGDPTALARTLATDVKPVLARLAHALASAGNTQQVALLARLFDHSTTAANTAAARLAADPTEAHAGAAAQSAVAALDVAAAEVLPVLASSAAVDMQALLADLSGSSAAAGQQATTTGAAVGASASPSPAGGGCACGGHDDEGLAELDTRVIPHAIRHATIFGALDGLAPGRGILLVANHNPLPLLAQLEQRAAGKFAVEYLEQGPETFRLSMIRR